jgi:hypothetical protein
MKFMKNIIGYYKRQTPAESQAQGAIEYLLLLAASVVIVAIVITFLMQSLESGTDTGRLETYEYICITLNSKTTECECYRLYVGDELPTDTKTQRECCADDSVKQDLKNALSCS